MCRNVGVYLSQATMAMGKSKRNMIVLEGIVNQTCAQVQRPSSW